MEKNDKSYLTSFPKGVKGQRSKTLTGFIQLTSLPCGEFLRLKHLGPSFQTTGFIINKMSKKKSDFLKEENVRIHKETMEFQKKSKLKKEKFKESKGG